MSEASSDSGGPNEQSQECASHSQRSRADGADEVRTVVDDGLSVATVARLYRTTPKTVAKWVARFRVEGIDGSRDRSSRPHSAPSQIVHFANESVGQEGGS